LFSEKVIPIVQKVADAFSSKPEGVGGTLNNLANSIKTFVQPIFEGLRSAFNKIKATVIENKDEFQAFFDVVKAAAPIIGKVIGAAFNVAGTVASTVLNLISNVLGALKTIINTAIDGINLVIRGLNLIKPGPDIASIGKIGSSTGSSSTGGISVPEHHCLAVSNQPDCYNETDCDSHTNKRQHRLQLLQPPRQRQPRPRQQMQLCQAISIPVDSAWVRKPIA
jgi:hypothetical protein